MMQGHDNEGDTMSAELKVQYRLVCMNAARGRDGMDRYESPELYDSVDYAVMQMIHLNSKDHDEVWGVETVTTLVHDWTGVGA